MADWTAEVFENEYLPADATDVHAIVTVDVHRRRHGRPVGRRGRGDHRRHVGFDVVAARSKIVSARKAAAAAIDEIVDGTWFAVIAGDNAAEVVYPAVPGDGAGRRDARVREAKDAVEHLEPVGGTAIGSWLAAATDLFGTVEAASAPRDPAHRRPRRVGERRPQLQAGDRRGAAASSSATAAASAPTGRSTSCAASRRRCSARSTSSPSPRTWPTTSGR